MNELTKRLRYLVSLDKPEKGGPYGGLAAQECMKAMTEVADSHDKLVEALRAISGHIDLNGSPNAAAQIAKAALEGLE